MCGNCVTNTPGRDAIVTLKALTAGPRLSQPFVLDGSERRRPADLKL
jgi:hypothetical protein